MNNKELTPEEIEQRERPKWTIHTWADFRRALSSMGERSKLKLTIDAEYKKRGNYKRAPRGAYARQKDNDQQK